MTRSATSARALYYALTAAMNRLEQHAAAWRLELAKMEALLKRARGEKP